LLSAIEERTEVPWSSEAVSDEWQREEGEKEPEAIRLFIDIDGPSPLFRVVSVRRSLLPLVLPAVTATVLLLNCCSSEMVQ
jgi:hypothetical protein